MRKLLIIIMVCTFHLFSFPGMFSKEMLSRFTYDNIKNQGFVKEVSKNYIMYISDTAQTINGLRADVVSFSYSKTTKELISYSIVKEAPDIGQFASLLVLIRIEAGKWPDHEKITENKMMFRWDNIGVISYNLDTSLLVVTYGP